MKRLAAALALAALAAGCAAPRTQARLIAGSIDSTDYPAAAMRADEEGVVVVAYIVGTDGRVTECAVRESSGSQALDAASCGIVQRRFQFEPATRGGRPVTESRVQRIVWMLPKM
jgi:periplasmic protein TonB